MNIRGVRLVGWSAVLLGFVAFSPVIGFAAWGIGTLSALPRLPFAVEGKGFVEGLGVGLAVMMWNLEVGRPPRDRGPCRWFVAWGH